MKTFIRNNRGLIALLLCMGLVRTALADWNPIPSASMRPTLLEGDVVLVNRAAYDLKIPLTHVSLWRTGEPRRGEVITFFSPASGERLIKRLVAVPGDVVEMRDEQLILNGRPVAYDKRTEVNEPFQGGEVVAWRSVEQLPVQGQDVRSHAIQVLPELSARRNFGPLTVPADQYFFLGDNRDNSADSRYIGFVPRALLIGHAHHVLASVDMKGNWMPRFARFGQAL
jgi:signal peptidase I